MDINVLSYTEDKTNVPLHKTDTPLLSEDCPGYGSSDCKKQTSPISTLQYKKYSNLTAKKESVLLKFVKIASFQTQIMLLFAKSPFFLAV